LSRRVSVPGADELFRRTVVPPQSDPGDTGPDETEEAAARAPSGRVRHDEKMTVYVTADELLDLDSARLALRREHGLAVDRGRIVREAIALVLADLEEHGYDSLIVQRLVEE
jgi:hypothetical protein